MSPEVASGASARRRLRLTVVSLAATQVCAILGGAAYVSSQRSGPVERAISAAVAPQEPDSRGLVRAVSRGGERTMLAIPAGFQRPFYKSEVGGATIAVGAFAIDQRPVSRRQYLEFVHENPRWRRSTLKRVFAEPSYLSDWDDDFAPGAGRLDAPVVFVSWFAARAYCEWRGKRLPGVIEWERAAAPDEARPTVEEKREASSFRFAMLRVGNETDESIWEWTADFNSNAISGGSEGDRANAASLFCGDGFRANDARDYGAFLRYAFRSSLKADFALKNLGFRCAGDTP
jgi:formylglycine-generating enzyme required for sulfatase activity